MMSAAKFVTLFLLCLAVGNGYDLTIMHTNDVHARTDECQKYGGVCTQEDLEGGDCVGGASRL